MAEAAREKSSRAKFVSEPTLKPLLLAHRILGGCMLMLLSELALALGDAEPLALDWRAPASCPNGSEVQREAMRLAGSGVPRRRQLIVRATVMMLGPERWTLVLSTLLDGVPGERAIQGSSCRAVADAAVVTLALTLNPELTLPGDGPEPPASAPTPPTPPVARPAPPPTKVARQRPRRSRPRAHARTLVGLRFGTTPEMTPEFGLGAGASLDRVSLWALGSYAPPQTAALGNTLGAKLWMYSAALLGCYGFSWHKVEVGPCGGLELTWVEGKGTGPLIQSEQQGVYWFSGVFGASMAWSLHPRVRFRLDGLGLLSPERPQAEIAGLDGPAYEPKVFGLRLFMGMDLTIP